MKISTIIVTRNKSCHVRTLHMILQMNINIMTVGDQHEITFVNDDPFAINDTISDKIKTSDRLVFIDYSIHVDTESLKYALLPFTDPNYHVLVLPCVKEGVDWNRFKTALKSGTYGTEPVSQLALEFDTVTGQCVKGDIYKVVSTEPKFWALDCKPVIKLLTASANNKKKTASSFKIPLKKKEMFDLFLQKSVKVYTCIAANLTCVYSHECMGNIMNASGVKANPV